MSPFGLCWFARRTPCRSNYLATSPECTYSLHCTQMICWELMLLLIKIWFVTRMPFESNCLATCPNCTDLLHCTHRQVICSFACSLLPLIKKYRLSYVVAIPVPVSQKAKKRGEQKAKKGPNKNEDAKKGFILSEVCCAFDSSLLICYFFIRGVFCV